MTRAKDDPHLVMRSAFSRMTNVRKATATSMPHGPDSFLIVCSTCSNGRLGRWR